MSRRSVSRTLALVATVPVLVAGTGCYEYHTGTVTTVRPSEIVHVTLTPEGSSSLAATIGPNATALDGRVLSSDATTLRLALTQIVRGVGPEEFLQNEPIDVPVSGASVITVRSVDRARSFLAFGGLIAGVIAARVFSDQAGVASVKGGPATGTK
jgi:hypothetical protein